MKEPTYIPIQEVVTVFTDPNIDQAPQGHYTHGTIAIIYCLN